MDRRERKDDLPTGPKKPTPKARRAERTDGLALLEDVGAIIAGSHDLQSSLEHIVQTVAKRMETEVCSLYILDPKEQSLTLWATHGLHRHSVGKVRMEVEEGLTGMVMERMEPVMVVDAIAHPRYKYFPETGEERFHSFLGVPVIVKRRPLGVLVVQTLRRRRFTADELALVRTIATQIGGTIVQTRLTESVRKKEKERDRYRREMQAAVARLEDYEKQLVPPVKPLDRNRTLRLVGQGAAPGFGTGTVRVFRPAVSFEHLGELRTENPEVEWQRFQAAIRTGVEDVDRVRARVAERLPDVDPSLFDTHRMMLEDKTLLSGVQKLIQEGFAAETALQLTVEEYERAFEEMDDRYMRDRAADVRDIGQRLLRNLVGVEDESRTDLAGRILVAEEFTLSDLVAIEHQRPRGIAMATGGVTSHAVILAKSFEIPTAVGVENLLESVHENEPVLLDGNSGIVYLNPSPEVVEEYARLDREYRAFNLELESLRDEPAETQDGRRVQLNANVGLFGDIAFAKQHGAEGVGLYRTEFPFLTYREFPDEAEQLDLYRTVLREMGTRPVTIRTLDLGADKYPSYLRAAKEDNPFLGWRSIRASLEMPDLFRTQLRAILRASAFGRVKLLFPMISGIEELWRAREILESARAELRTEGVAFDEQLPVGIMIEVPSAVALADELADEADFFSLGTNDLIQYVLAVDRNNRRVAPLYESLHPAVLRAIHEAVAAAKAKDKWVSVCGEMAADPLCTAILLGFGVDELSMEPFSVPLIKRLVRSLSNETVDEIGQAVLTMSSVKEIKGYLFSMMKQAGVLELIEIYH